MDTPNPQPSGPSVPPADDAEFVGLLTSHQPALRLYVASLLPGEPGAGDVAQQANATIWRKRGDFAPGSNFKAWIFSIARYEVLNFRKQQARSARLVFSGELEDLIADELPDHDADLEARQRHLQFCLAKLRPADRALIERRYFQPGRLQEYAEEVGRSVNSLKVTLHRLRNKLHQCIEGRMRAAGEAGA